MDQQVTNQVGSSNAQAANLSASEGRRNCWIVTGYAVSFLTLAIVLAYYFSSYVTK
jgi:hypothetical protein